MSVYSFPCCKKHSSRDMMVSPNYLGHTTLLPPSMAMVCPVMNDAALDARKTIIEATSSTLPTRPMGCVVLQCSKNDAYLKKRIKVLWVMLS